LSQLVLQHLVRNVLEDGSIPLVVYLPYKSELLLSNEPENKYVPISARVLHNAEIEYFDPTPCLKKLDISKTYMKEGHYSPQANNQIARCLEPVIRELLSGLKR
jgi:hypothetical protein